LPDRNGHTVRLRLLDVKDLPLAVATGDADVWQVPFRSAA